MTWWCDLGVASGARERGGDTANFVIILGVSGELPQIAATWGELVGTPNNPFYLSRNEQRFGALFRRMPIKISKPDLCRGRLGECCQDPGLRVRGELDLALEWDV